MVLGSRSSISSPKQSFKISSHQQADKISSNQSYSGLGLSKGQKKKIRRNRAINRLIDKLSEPCSASKAVDYPNNIPSEPDLEQGLNHVDETSGKIAILKNDKWRLQQREQALTGEIEQILCAQFDLQHQCLVQAHRAERAEKRAAVAEHLFNEHLKQHKKESTSKVRDWVKKHGSK